MLKWLATHTHSTNHTLCPPLIHICTNIVRNSFDFEFFCTSKHNAKRWGELDTRMCIIARPRTATFLSSILLLLVIDTHAEAVLYCTNWTTSGLQFSDNAPHIQSWQDEAKGSRVAPLSVFSFSYEEDLGSEWRMAFLSSSVECEHSRPAWLRTPICNTISAQSMHISKAQRRKGEPSERGQRVKYKHPFSPLLTYNIQRCVSPFLSLSCCRSYCTLTYTRSNIQATRCTERFTLLRLRK